MASTSSNPQSSNNPLAAKPGQQGIDPRGPRFGASITVVLLAIDVILGLTGVSTTAGTTLAQRVAVEQFARQAQCAHGIVGGVTTRCIRQNGVAVRRNHIQQVRCARILADIRTSNGDGNNFRAGSGNRLAGFIKILVLARAYKQTRTVGFAADRNGVQRILGMHF